MTQVLQVDLAALERDPYPVFETIRRHGGTAWIEPLKLWYVVGYDDVRTILNDPAHYAVGTDHSLILDLFGRNMLTQDGHEHARVRAGFRGDFMPAAIRAAMTDRLGEVVDALIDGFPRHGEVDLRSGLAARLPVLAVLSLFGIPAETEPRVRAWYDVFEKAIANFSHDADVRHEGQRAAAEFGAFFVDLIEAARRRPVSGLLGKLLQRPDDERLSDEEIVSNAMLIFFGGISTVEALLLNTLYAAALHDYRFVDARGTAAAIDETMRWLSPVQSATRHVVSADGCFATGDTVNAMIGAANRDPAIFADPTRWDPARRTAGHHLGFATGAHFCLGSHLAKLEVTMAIVRLFTRFPALRVTNPEGTVLAGYEFRQPEALIATLR